MLLLRHSQHTNHDLIMFVKHCFFNNSSISAKKKLKEIYTSLTNSIHLTWWKILNKMSLNTKITQFFDKKRKKKRKTYELLVSLLSKEFEINLSCHESVAENSDWDVRVAVKEKLFENFKWYPMHLILHSKMTYAIEKHTSLRFQ